MTSVMSLGARLQRDSYGRIPDEEVVAMRIFHESHPDVGWDEVGRLWEVDSKTAYRICTGRSRAEVGGPIEAADLSRAPARCPGCGAMCCGPCVECQRPFVALAIQIIRDSGLLPDEAFDECVKERMPSDPTVPCIRWSASWRRRRLRPRESGEAVEYEGPSIEFHREFDGAMT